MCQKVPYETKQAAKKDITFIKHQDRRFNKRSQHHKKQNKKMSAYLCRLCGHWHITTCKAKRKY